MKSKLSRRMVAIVVGAFALFLMGCGNVAPTAPVAGDTGVQGVADGGVDDDGENWW
jgi:hypothetical protein